MDATSNTLPFHHNILCLNFPVSLSKHSIVCFLDSASSQMNPLEQELPAFRAESGRTFLSDHIVTGRIVCCRGPIVLDSIEPGLIVPVTHCQRFNTNCNVHTVRFHNDAPWCCNAPPPPGEPPFYCILFYNYFPLCHIFCLKVNVSPISCTVCHFPSKEIISTYDIHYYLKAFPSCSTHVILPVLSSLPSPRNPFIITRESPS